MAIVATPTGAFIGGQWVDGDGERIDVHSPSTGELVGSVQASTPAQVDAAVAAAKAAFPAWRATSVLERVEICRRAFDMCMERNEEIARMISMEVGKTIRESREEMEEFTVDHFRRASEDVLRHTGAVHPSTQERTTNKRILVVQEPIGVIAAVSPWNFPVDIAGIPIVYGLALGCTVVWKPSEYAPLCAQMFTQLLSDAGFPPGTINVVHGRGETGAQVVRHPDVASIVFTGSVETGEKVARDAGLKNRVLELGGNGPQIVLADGDLEKAADAAIVGCFYLAGQCCTAAERILVHSSVKDRFVELLVERARGLKVGDPLDDDDGHGPAVHAGRAGADEAARRRRGRQGRHGRARRRQRRPVPRADGDRRRHQRDADRAGGDVRPGRSDHGVRDAGRGAGHRQRDGVRADRIGLHPLAARRVAGGGGAAARHRPHQRDHELLGSAGAVRRRQEVGIGPRAGRRGSSTP